MSVDVQIAVLANELCRTNGGLNLVARMAQTDLLKMLPPMLLFWGLWFRPATMPEETATRRTTLLAGFATVMVSMLVARMLALFLPFRARPIYSEGLPVAPLGWMTEGTLSDWSAFPSDHAVMFFALATVLFAVSRPVGVVALLHAAFVVSLPRVCMGLHWFTDILAGAAVGILLVALLLRPASALLGLTGIVPFFSRHEWIGYPLLFLATWEFAGMFETIREILSLLTGIAPG